MFDIDIGVGVAGQPAAVNDSGPPTVVADPLTPPPSLSTSEPPLKRAKPMARVNDNDPTDDESDIVCWAGMWWKRKPAVGMSAKTAPASPDLLYATRKSICMGMGNAHTDDNCPVLLATLSDNDEDLSEEERLPPVLRLPANELRFLGECLKCCRSLRGSLRSPWFMPGTPRRQ